MGRHELIDPKPRAQTAKPSEALAGMIDDTEAGAEIRGVAVHPLHRTQFAYVTNWTFPGGHE